MTFNVRAGEQSPARFPARLPSAERRPARRLAKRPAPVMFLRPVVERLPRFLLGAEGVAVAASATILYFHAGYPWWLFLALILAPDLSLVGFAAGPRVGAATYDAAHTYVLPAALTVVGVVTETDAAAQVGLVWLAHIGVDRAVGYGLRYPTRTKETHLQRV
jgi:hypothetical protein